MFSWASSFLYIQMIAIIFSLSGWVISVQNPIHSILILILVFFGGSFFLFLIQMEYFALLFMIVYVGAIVVLFLFIIMMLELKVINITERFFDWLSYKNLILIFLVFQILFFLNGEMLENMIFFLDSEKKFEWNLYEINFENNYSFLLQRVYQLQGLGRILFTEYGWSIILAAFLLLLSMIGSVLLTLETTIFSELKTQNVNVQAWRNSNFAQNSLWVLKN